MLLPDPINRLRRKTGQLLDQAAAKSLRFLLHKPRVPAFDGDARFALLSVNYASSHYLKLMLCSLAAQGELQRLQRIVICDNRSDDGGLAFLRQLAAAVPKITLVEKRHWTNHAAGMRAAIAALERLDGGAQGAANILLAVDPDVVFLRPDTLTTLAAVFTEQNAAFAGELRHHVFPQPEAQASFLAVRRDWAQRRDVSPWVNHGSPAWWLQRDIQAKGGKAVDFPNNRMGYALHRGRSSVAATREYAPLNSYATTANRLPHYMGVPGGEQLWQAAESRHAALLGAAAEEDLIGLLREKLG